MLTWILKKFGYIKLNTINKYVYGKASSYLDIDLNYLANDMLHTAIYTDETIKEVAENVM